jgi:hypothetical protein
LAGAAGQRPGHVRQRDIALFDYEGDGVYQVHFLFQSRGRKAIEHARESFKIMFTEHGANLILGLVPDFRRDVECSPDGPAVTARDCAPKVRRSVRAFRSLQIPVEGCKP